MDPESVETHEKHDSQAPAEASTATPHLKKAKELFWGGGGGKSLEQGSLYRDCIGIKVMKM